MVHVQQLKSDLADYKQRDMTITAYYEKMKALWDELANYEQIPSYICGGCKCNIEAQLEKRREEEKVHQFFMGLADAIFGIVCSNLLASKPLPPLNSMYLTLIQEERMKSITRTKEDRGETMGLAVQAGNKMKGRVDLKYKNVTCTTTKIMF